MNFLGFEMLELSYYIVGMKKKKLPTDINELAKSLVDLATDESPPEEISSDKPQKNQAAVELGRLGGMKGGKARAEKLTAEQRSEIAKLAAQARWKKTGV
ncbi:hypothetical protein MWR57_05795 [Desulfovibrionaceae bacterium CB1MN]|uniref:hypothetical protein n=1 Tax=Hydrosulfovibrio ferrireducens TaxID=2934181 RepID=UPI003ABAE2E4